jgi:hypothetical protein
MSNSFPPSIELCKLWRKVSAKGNEYLIGRMAGARITVLPNRNKNADTDADFVVLLSAAPQGQQQQQQPRQPSFDERERQYEPRRQRYSREPADRQLEDVPVPI